MADSGVSEGVFSMLIYESSRVADMYMAPLDAFSQVNTMLVPLHIKERLRALPMPVLSLITDQVNALQERFVAISLALFFRHPSSFTRRVSISNIVCFLICYVCSFWHFRGYPYSHIGHIAYSQNHLLMAGRYRWCLILSHQRVQDGGYHYM